MKKPKAKILSLIFGVIVAVIAVYQLHRFILVESCLRLGEKYVPKGDACMHIETHKEYFIVFTNGMFALYAVVGVLVASIIAFFTNKFLSTIGSNNSSI